MATHDDDIYVISDEDVLTARQSRPSSARAEPGVGPIAEPVISIADPPAARAEAPVRLPPRKAASVPIASSLSVLLCGAGQAYNGQVKLGALFLLIELFAVAAHWSLVRSWSLVQEMAYIFSIHESELLLGVAIVDLLLVVFVLYNVGQAYRHAEARAKPFDGVGIPAVSAIASAAVPGWGQILNGQIGKGIFFLFGLLAGLYAAGLAFLFPLTAGMFSLALDPLAEGREAMVALGLGFAGGLLWMLSVYDAFLVARYKREMI